MQAWENSIVPSDLANLSASARAVGGSTGRPTWHKNWFATVSTVVCSQSIKRFTEPIATHGNWLSSIFHESRRWIQERVRILCPAKRVCDYVTFYSWTLWSLQEPTGFAIELSAGQLSTVIMGPTTTSSPLTEWPRNLALVRVVLHARWTSGLDTYEFSEQESRDFSQRDLCYLVTSLRRWSWYAGLIVGTFLQVPSFQSSAAVWASNLFAYPLVKKFADIRPVYWYFTQLIQFRCVAFTFKRTAYDSNPRE